jgi:L-amino acid N-acyltransferase YncA
MSTNRFPHRLARAADLPGIVAIYNDTVPSRLVTADLEAVSVQSRRAWFAEHSSATRPLWVVELEGRLAAWLSFSNFYGRPAYAGTAEISVYVAAHYRRRGIATALLDEAVRAAPQFGVRTLLGFIFDHNEPSLQLFECAGFQRWGTLPRVALLDNVERGVVLLGLRVAP